MARDRAVGLTPLAIMATAASDTGSVDAVADLAALAQQEAYRATWMLPTAERPACPLARCRAAGA